MNKGHYQSSFMASVAQSGDIGNEVLTEIKRFLAENSIHGILSNNKWMIARGHKMGWRLGVHGRKNMTRFLPQILPFLVVKKPLAQDMLRYLRMFPDNQKILLNEVLMRRKKQSLSLGPLIVEDRKMGLTYRELMKKHRTSSTNIKRCLDAQI